jgi:hypothetical protein
MARKVGYSTSISNLPGALEGPRQTARQSTASTHSRIGRNLVLQRSVCDRLVFAWVINLRSASRFTRKALNFSTGAPGEFRV